MIVFNKFQLRRVGRHITGTHGLSSPGTQPACHEPEPFTLAPTGIIPSLNLEFGDSLISVGVSSIMHVHLTPWGVLRNRDFLTRCLVRQVVRLPYSSVCLRR